MSGLVDYLSAFLGFINEILIPFLFGVALLVFLVNVFRFFILGADNQEGRDKAQRLALYGILAFVFMVSIWGIVNLIVSGLGFNNGSPLTPDYLERSGASNAGLSRNPFDTGRNDNTVSQNPFDTGRNDTTVNRNPFDTGRDPTAGANYNTAVNDGLDTIFESYNLQTPLYDLLVDTTSSGYSDMQRIQIAKTMNAAGVISNSDLNSMTTEINTIRNANGASAINTNNVQVDQNLLAKVRTYDRNLNQVDQFFQDWYGSDSFNYEVTMIELFDTEEGATLAERRSSANDIFDSIRSQQPNAVNNIERLVENNFAIEEQGW